MSEQIGEVGIFAGGKFYPLEETEPGIFTTNTPLYIPPNEEFYVGRAEPLKFQPIIGDSIRNGFNLTPDGPCVFDVTTTKEDAFKLGDKIKLHNIRGMKKLSKRKKKKK